MMVFVAVVLDLINHNHTILYFENKYLRSSIKIMICKLSVKNHKKWEDCSLGRSRLEANEMRQCIINLKKKGN